MTEDLEFEADFLTVVILTEHPGMPYDEAHRMAIKEIREDRMMETIS